MTGNADMRGSTSLNDTRARRYRRLFLSVAAACMVVPMYATASANGPASIFFGPVQGNTATVRLRRSGLPLTPMTPAEMSGATAEGLPVRGPILAPQSSAPNAVLLWDEINVLKTVSQEGSGGSVTLNIVH